jgi:hypothetical protein
MEHRKEGNEWSLACLKCREYGKQFFTSTISDMVNCFFATKVRDVNPDEVGSLLFMILKPRHASCVNDMELLRLMGTNWKSLKKRLRKGLLKWVPYPQKIGYYGC